MVGVDLTLDMLRQGQRNVAERAMADRVQLVAGRAEQMPFADGTFDALTFTYLLRYVDDPQATLRELARVVKPGGAVASLEFLVPRSRFWRFWWWLYTAAPASAGRLGHRGEGVVRGWPVPRPQHLGPLPSVPGGMDGRGLEAGRLRRCRRATHEPRRRPGHVGEARRWLTSPHRNHRPTARGATPAYYAARPGGWRDWWTLLHPPYTAWHLSYVVIGACLAPVVNVTRLVATLLAFFCAVGSPPTHSTNCTAGPCAPTSPPPPWSRSPWPGLAGAVALGVVGVIQVGPALVPFLVLGPVLVLGYNFELFGGVIHNDAGFAASWGAFPVLIAYVAQTGTLALAPLLAAAGAFALSLAAAGAQHPGPHAPPAGHRVEGSITLADGDLASDRPGDAARPARARAPGHVLGRRTAGRRHWPWPA